jgi:hypothetical protein
MRGSIFKKDGLPPVKLLLVIVVLKGRAEFQKESNIETTMSISKKANPTAEQCLTLAE